MKRILAFIKKTISKKNTARIIISLTLLLFIPHYSNSLERFDPQKVYGPRIDKLCMVIIRNSDAQILAAQKGEIDIMGDMALPSDIDRLSRDPNLRMSLARGFHAFFLLFNNKAALGMTNM